LILVSLDRSALVDIPGEVTVIGARDWLLGGEGLILNLKNLFLEVSGHPMTGIFWCSGLHPLYNLNTYPISPLQLSGNSGNQSYEKKNGLGLLTVGLRRHVFQLEQARNSMGSRLRI
jgi:hypothetical protein